MKYFGALFVATLFFVLVHSAPRVAPDSEEWSDSSDKKNTDTVLILPGTNRGISRSNLFDEFSDRETGPVLVDDPFGYSFFESLRKRLWDQMRQAAEIFSNSDGGFGLFGKVPKGGNTTSTTKIIDGHVVTINDTTYTDGDDKNGSVFHFRVVDIKPQNGTLEIGAVPDDVESIIPSETGKEPESTTPPRSVETVEDLENEIPKSQTDILTA